MLVLCLHELSLYHGIAYQSVSETERKIRQPTTLRESPAARVDHKLQHRLLRQNRSCHLADKSSKVDEDLGRHTSYQVA